MPQPEDPWGEFNPVDPQEAKPLPSGGVYIPPSMTPLQEAEQARKAREEGRDIAAESRDVTRLGIAERGEERAAVADEQALRKEFRSLPAVAEYQTVARSYAGALGTAPNASGDYALIVAYAKMLDPASVVREGETASVSSADSTIGRSVAKFQKEFGIEGGGELSPELRDRIRSEMRNLAQQYGDAYDQARGEYEGLAGSYGYPAERIVGPHLLDPYRDDIDKFWAPKNAMDQPSVEQKPGVTGAAGAFKTPEDIALEKRLNDALAAGATVDELRAIAGGRTGVPATQEELDAARKAGRKFNVLPSGYRPEETSVLGITPESKTGAFVVSAANSLTSGGLDEIVGALGGDAAMAQAAKDQIRERYPVSSFAGEVAGQAMQMAGVTKALGAVGATGRAATIGAEAAQGAAYGAGEANENRLAGAALGTAGAVGGRAIAERIVEPGVQAVIQRIARDTGAPPAEVEKMVAEALTAAKPPMEEVAGSQVTDEVATLARQAASLGPRSRTAKRKLAELAAVDPEAAAAAERLGVDLPPDVLSENAQLKNLTGLARSQVGSEAQGSWQDLAGRAAARAETLLNDIGASNDLAQLSENVGARIKSTMEDLKTQADALRTEVDEVTDPKAAMDAAALRERMTKTVEELGGIEQARGALNPLETRLLRLIDDENPPTYAYFERIRRDIGAALEKGKGPFADIDQKTLGEYYAALKQDRIDFVRRVGGDELADKMAASNALYSKMYDARGELIDLFGKDLQGGIVPALRSALTSGNKGDIGKLNRMLANIPEDMQGEVLLSGILAESQSKVGAREGSVSFANMSKMLGGLFRNQPVYRRVAKAVGPEGDRVLRDLYAVGRRIADAESRVIPTGKANQAQLATINAESLVGAVVQATARRGATVAGAGAGAAMGPLGSMAGAAAGEQIGKNLTSAGRSRLDKVHGLLSSPQFRETVEKVAAGDTSPGVLNKLANSNAFVKFGRSLGLDTPEARMEWLRRAAAGSGTVAATQVADQPAPQIEMTAP